MAISPNKRNYNLTDADLCMFTSNLCIAMTSDLPDLSVFGITDLKITALNTLCNAFETFPSDEVLLAYITGATEEKNVLLEEVKESIRNMVVRCQVKWGADSWQEKSLGVEGMNRFSDEVLLVAARRTHEQMSEFLPELADTGLTEAMLDDFKDLNDDFEEALNELKSKIVNRDKKTRERIAKGNEIYALVSTYCEIGKRVYAMSDPARYDQYIIYTESSPGTLTAPTDLSFYLPSTTFSWSEVPHATSFSFEYSPDGISFEVVFEGSDQEVQFVPPQSGWSFFRVRARNASGFGPYSTILKSGYYPGTVLPAPENLVLQLAAGSPNTLQLNWDAVPAASSYSVNKSSVPVGAPVGPFAFVTSTHDPEYVETVLPGHRYYYNLTASNSYQWSGVSVNVFLDVPV